VTEQAEQAAMRAVEEQQALRRVATLVARAVEPEEVFGLVTEEVGRVFGVQYAAMVRYADERGIVVGRWDAPGEASSFPVGTNVSLEGDSAVIRVYRTGAPARLDDYADRPGEIARSMRELGVRSSVAAPITVEGRLWGAVVVVSDTEERFPEGIEGRLGDFADLVALALASASAREQLAASRARIVEAGDAERRRLERNLHDGAQQRLVTLALSLRLARAKLPGDPIAAEPLLDSAIGDLDQALAELRELARGLHPAILTDHGLAPALRALTRRAPVPVRLGDVPEERFPEPIEATAYYLVSEALTNVTRYAEASSVEVRLTSSDGRLRVEVADDGRGGAQAAAGSGLRGLADRVEALSGRFELESPPGAGTVVRAELPTSA
jgi:signal transduction histidine kinase